MAHHEYEKANQKYEKANDEYEKASQEYEKAKDFLEDIVLSFDRELKRESAKFDTMVSKVEGSYTTADVSYRKAETIERKIEPIETQIDVLVQSYQTISQEITDNQTENMQYNSNVLSGLSGLEVKLKNIDTTQEILKTKIADLEGQLKKLAITPPSQPQVITEGMLPPIPIKRDKALATLTDTEIQVLEMLSKEGSKTAPEIKESVHLSREHTARLMKKLYEDGYLEREAGKLPFRYSIKKEMEALLQKVENPAV
jgi:CTP-dependent riboflavin kinase